MGLIMISYHHEQLGANDGFTSARVLTVMLKVVHRVLVVRFGAGW